MTAYYNEFDPYAAQWLRNLIDRGLIAPGDVDDRSIVEVSPSDLEGYTQCHFFAGIGVWSYALRQAGWSDDTEVWTGSCPCQPFSAAGTQKGVKDERHLWPEFFRLIRGRRPSVVFGEQVAAKGGLTWFDHVSSDLEGEGYAVGAVDTCAAGFGAPHLRQRLYWVADHHHEGLEGRRSAECGEVGAHGQVASHGTSDRVADDSGAGLEGQAGSGCAGENTIFDTTEHRRSVGGFWRDAEWLGCRDGKARATEPGTFPLAYGPPARVGRLRSYGNAIVAPQAQEIIEAYMDVRSLR